MLSNPLLTLAGSQHGMISRCQLVEQVGVSVPTINRGARTGLLVRVASGVFRIASSPDTFESRCAAASLFGAGDGFVGGTSAARLREMKRMNSDVVEYTVPHTFRSNPPPWMRLRFTNWYDADEHREDFGGGIVIATPLRMLFGLAARFNQHRFDGAADDAWNSGLITPESVAAFLGEHRRSGKNGVLRIERWLERALQQMSPSQSYLERDLIDAIDAIGLPVPRRQHPLRLRSGELIHLDAAWPDIRFAVEPGHSYFHRFGGGQERDHRRDAACGELGWHILRLDETMLADLRSAVNLVRRVHDRRAVDLRSP